MPDIATIWDPANGRGDFVVVGPDLQSGSDLETAVLISLFTDRRADPGDVIPDGSGDPRGWWGDSFLPRPIGSKLWLIDRAKQTDQTLTRAKDYAQDALQWLVDDGIAGSVDVAASWPAPGFLGLRIVIRQGPGADPVNLNYQWAWSGVS